MSAQKGRILITFGVVLALLGAASVLFTPGVGFGFNSRAVSGLIVGLAGGGLAILFGCLARAGKRPAVTAGLILAFALLVMCSHRALVSWQKVNAGLSDKSYAATLISLMAAASLVTVVAVARGLAFSKPTS